MGRKVFPVQGDAVYPTKVASSAGMGQEGLPWHRLITEDVTALPQFWPFTEESQVADRFSSVARTQSDIIR